MYLDVTAVDASGRPVRDLAVSDFEIVAGDQPATIHGVTVVDLPGAAAAPIVRGRLAPAQVAHDVARNDDLVDRYLAIVLDDIARPGANADNWMTTAGLDLARALVDRLGPDDRGTIFFSFMGRQQGLTSDRDRLRAAIDGFAPRSVTPADCPAGGLDACLIDTLQRVAEALPAESRRRKTIVVISDRAGLPSAGAPGVERAVRALHATNAVVYGMTPASVGNTPGEARPSLAEATGGRALADSPTQAPIDTVWTESGSYYLVALESPARDGAHRPVSVRVNRPDVAVRARGGVFPPGGGELPAGATTALEAAMVSPHQMAALPMGVSASVFAVPGRREAVVVISTAVTSAPAPGAPGWLADVAATAFDAQWRPRASHRQTIEVTGTVPGPRTVDVLSAIELLPGRYELRVGAESGGRAGSVFMDIEVPEFQTTALSASGAIVSTAPTPYTASPILADTLPVTPTTRRMFLRNEPAEVLVRFYQGGRGRLRNLPVSLRIADANGEAIIQGDEVIAPSQFDAGRSTEWRFVLPLERLAPGDYLLTVEASLDDRQVARHVRFAVMK